MPQLIEQWRLKLAKGIAIGFITIWFLGDLFNLAGSIWAGLLPEVIFLAVWFCIADSLIITSYVYYLYIYKRHEITGHERLPLIGRRRSSTLTEIAVEPQNQSLFVKFIFPILIVVAAGVTGFLLSGTKDGDNTPIDAPISVGPQILGYCLAFLYLGARIPQIIQNYHRKSVSGLSLLFFLFSTLGNLTYAGQILFFRNDSQYILLNLSWLLGSLGTIFEDSFIFLQFYMYRDNGVFHESI